MRISDWSSDVCSSDLSAHDADVEILERIAGRSYREIEAALLALERLDDSPVLQIGKVWKAKSALELLALFGERIDVGVLDRYFAEVEAVLAAAAPFGRDSWRE